MLRFLPRLLLSTICLWFAWPSCCTPLAAEERWQVSSTGCDASLRGLSVVGQGQLWACGAKGTVVRSRDSGRNWTTCCPNGFDQLEFRSIVAFDDQRAIIASAGTPAIILLTQDGGQSWSERYRHPAPAAFFDGMKFWDASRGIAFSDPVDGRFVVVTTNDGGLSWNELPQQQQPPAREQEAAFAASNSSILVTPDGGVYLGTGGTVAANSRVLTSHDYGLHWAAHDCPLPSGQAAGIFSLAYATDSKRLIAVGGDYRPDARSELTAATSDDAGRTWRAASQAPTSFVSAVCPVQRGQADQQFIACGPSGSFVSADGDQWRKFTDVGFHALAVNDAGQVFAVGSEGRFGTLTQINSP